MLFLLVVNNDKVKWGKNLRIIISEVYKIIFRVLFEKFMDVYSRFVFMLFVYVS